MSSGASSTPSRFPRRLPRRQASHPGAARQERPGTLRLVAKHLSNLSDPFSLETQLDPYPSYARLLEHEPVYRNRERGFYALSRYACVQGALRGWETYSSAGGVTVDDLLDLTGPSFRPPPPPRLYALRDILK